MNKRYRTGTFWQGLVLSTLMLCGGSIEAAGLLQPSDGSLPPLEIRDHRVEVVIEDGYAITRVEQVFHNPHNRDLEAIYSFPVPEKGAMAEFTLWIDGKPVTGEVLERKQAQQVYEEEKQAGREAGITEKDSYKTFDTRVSPVRAGQDARIRLVYLQPAHIDTGIGRYLYPLEEGGVDEEKLAFWTANEEVIGHFSFDLKIRSAYPVEAVRMPNHPNARLQQLGEGEWNIHFDNGSNPIAAASTDEQTGKAPDDNRIPLETEGPGTAFRLDRDLLVYWRHREGLPGSVDLIAHKLPGEARGTFMMVVTPGDDLQPIIEGRDWVFVLDMSGSMEGKFATLADGVQRALEKMRSADRFRIVLFNETARELTPGFVQATPQNIAKFSRSVALIHPDNGTNLYAGLKQGLESLDTDRTNALVLVTDGVANVGETRQRQFLELIRKKDVRLFTFIMGNSSNRPLLESMTEASNGFSVNISNSDDIVGQLLAATSKVTHEALHGVKLEIDGVKTADITPTNPGSLYRGQQLVVFGHYWGDGMAEVRLTGKLSGHDKTYQTRFGFPGSATDNPELERLWAYAGIREAMKEIDVFGEDPDLKQSVVDLAVEYGLVTDYTAMVVMRDEVVNKRGIKRSNRDRLESEQSAAAHRQTRATVSRRVDAQQPMYRSSRPSYSGGGALDAWYLVLLLPLSWLAFRQPAG
jgi:Ca-activated chloride channel family protein